MDRDHIGLIASDMDYTLLDENGHLPEGFARLVGAWRLFGDMQNMYDCVDNTISVSGQ